MRLTKKQVKGLKYAAEDIFNKEYCASCFVVYLYTNDNLREKYGDFYGIKYYARCFPDTDYHEPLVSEETTNQRVLMLLFFAEAHK